MSYRKKNVITICILFALVLLIYITRTFNDFGTTIFFFASVFIGIFLAFYFTRQEVFTTWKKFAIPYLALSVILLAIPDKAGGNIGPSFDNEFVAFTLSVLFFIISLLIIAIKSWKLRG